jgi:hypothetical protein
MFNFILPSHVFGILQAEAPRMRSSLDILCSNISMDAINVSVIERPQKYQLIIELSLE